MYSAVDVVEAVEETKKIGKIEKKLKIFLSPNSSGVMKNVFGS
jgi:hypothetical protein